MPVPHHSIDGVIYESLRIRRSICTQAVGDCPSKLRILNEEGCLMRPRLSPEDQDLGSSATLYCYREQSGGGGSTEVLPSADVPEGEKPLKAKARRRRRRRRARRRARTSTGAGRRDLSCSRSAS